MDNLLLSQLVYTRISHDLAGSVGAIYNGTELLVEDLSFAQESGNLIKDSAEMLMVRLRFFRQTFGLPKDDEDTTADYLKTFSMPFSLNRACLDNLQRALVMVLTDYFYRGADFNLTENAIVAYGSAFKDVSCLTTLLQDGKGDETAANAPAFYAHCLAKQQHVRLSVSEHDNSIEIRLDLDINS